MRRTARALAPLLLVTSCATPVRRPYVPPLDYGSGTPVEATSEDAALRASAPPLAPEAPVRPASIRETRLANGLRVVVLERHGFPAVAARLTTDTRGIEEGDVGGRRAYYLGHVFLSPSPGAPTSADCSVTACRVATHGPTSRLDEVLGRIADVVFATGVTPEVLERRLAQARHAFDVEHAGPGGAVIRNGAAMLFGHTHRYGQPPPRADAPTLAELQALRDRGIVPRASTLVIVGDVTLDAAAAQAERSLGEWRDVRVPEVETEPPPAAAGGPRIAAFHVRVVRQILGAVVARGPAPGDADAAAFEVVGQLLGAPLASIAYQHIREEMGAAYSVGVSVQRYPDVSSLMLAGSFDREKAIDGVQGLLDGIRSLREAEVGPEALEQAKRSLAGAWRRARSTDAGTARLLADAVEFGLSPSSIDEQLARYASVTAADVRRAARAYLGIGALRVVLVGDPEFLVTAQALRFGVPVRVDDYGREL